MMKIDDFRREAHKLVGLPPDCKYPVITPSQLDPECHPGREMQFYIAMGRIAIHYLNSRRK